MTSSVLFLFALAAVLQLSTSTFFNFGCGCPPPPPCLPKIELPPLCLPSIQLPTPCCGTPCCGGRKKRSVNSEEGVHDFEKPEIVVEKSVCNNEELKQIMKESMHGTPQEAKMRIAENAESLLGGQYTVICSSGSFSYLTTTNSYCLETSPGLNCYAFRTSSGGRRVRRFRKRE